MQVTVYHLSSESDRRRRRQCHQDQSLCQLPAQPAPLQRPGGDGDGFQSHGSLVHGGGHLHCWVRGVWGEAGSGVAGSRQEWRQAPRRSKWLAEKNCLLLKYFLVLLVQLQTSEDSLRKVLFLVPKAFFCLTKLLLKLGSLFKYVFVILTMLISTGVYK